MPRIVVAPVPPPSREIDSTVAPHGPLLVVLLGLMTAMGPLSLDMYLPALPDIAGHFGAPAAEVQLSLAACLGGIAAGQLLGGPLSDRWGRRRPAIAGMTAYAIVSLLCALAPSAPIFILLRLGQGLTGGVGVVVARAVVRDRYAGTAAARYFSRLTLIFGVAPVAAPTLGGAVLRWTSWQGIFVGSAVIGAALTLAIVRGLPESLPVQRRSAGGLAGTWRTARTLFADRITIGYALAQGLGFAGMFAYISASSFVLQQGYGVTATVFALVYGLNALGLVALSQANRRLLLRFAPRQLLIGALATGLVAAAGALVGAGAGDFVVLAAALSLFVATIGMVLPNATALALERHPHRAGAAAAVTGGIQSAVGAVAAPLVGLGAPGHGVPMTIVTVAFAGAALLAVLTLTRHPQPV